MISRPSADDCGLVQLWVLGDLVNYGPEPGRVIEAVMASAAAVVRGNHDLVALNRLVRDRIAHAARSEPGVQTPERTLTRGSRPCRDIAWLLGRAARGLGFTARFVSGHLIQLADPAGPVPGVEADRADLHAWAEVYLPGAG